MAKKSYFDSVNLKINFSDAEKKTLEDWYRKGIVKKYLSKNSKSDKIFSFLDGPITANNPMGVHHAWGRTYKDIWQRYKNMRGFRQRFQNGFDCQGLWVEVEVEKELGLKNKKDIENLIPGDKNASIAKFVSLCKERVFKYAAIQTEQSKRLGYLMDWENSYYTLSEDNNYMIWHFLKKCHDKGLIYKGTDVVPWCPRCETAISEHEILTENYREITHESLFLKFPLVGKNNEYLLVWTTTPWTVPANIAVAVDGNLDYILARQGDECFWVSKSLAGKILGNSFGVVKEIKGSEMAGWKYTGAFDEFPAISSVSKDRGFHEVVITDAMIMPISEEEGTGLVHTSTGTGAEDHHLGKKLGLPVVPAINDDASYLSNFGFLSGKNAKKHPELVIDYLKTYKEGSYLFKTENYKHRYPACWRCKTELVWKLTDEWYIAIDPVREDMKTVTKKMKWLPKFGLKRELDWLGNMHDWLISKKNRYWGLALPVWECKKCLNFEVIGGIDELKSKAVAGWDKFSGHSPHKPWIDEVKINCSKCGEVMSRIPDVGNPWLDAGIVTYSTVSSDNKSKPLYWTDKEMWKRWIPADFITESFPGQFKNWFYSIIAMSTVLENIEPARTVLGYATLLAEDGRPMHKSWGNSIEFNEGAEKIGVDVMRWMYATQNPSDNLLFGYRIADEVRRKFHLKIWNVYNFFVTYATVDGYRPYDNKFDAEKTGKISILDRWILVRYSHTLKEAEVQLDKYNAFAAAHLIESFIDDFSNWYIRRSRERVGVAADNISDKSSFYDTTYFILLNLSKMLSPFIPFISESIYTNLTKEVSVNLADWPTFDIPQNKKDKKLEEYMTSVREIAELGHSQRKALSIPVRQPLSKVTIKTPRVVKNKKIVSVLLEELNVKKAIFRKSNKLEIILDTKLTKALIEESKTRELLRNIQEERKKTDISLTESVDVISPWLPESKILLNKITKKALVRNLDKGRNFEVKPISK